MDYTVKNVAMLFDELLRVLNDHQTEEGVLETFACLNAAKFNYEQRDIDHMMNNLILAFHQLSVLRNPQLQAELRSVIQAFVKYIDEAGSRMAKLAEEYRASGGKLLSREEILEEVNERRGASH